MSQATKEKIVHAAIRCIERSGLQEVRSRDIAGEAGVNLALINYHFGSKDDLLAFAMEATIENGMKGPEELLATKEIPLHDRLEEFLRFVIAKTQEFPNLSRAHLFDALLQGKVDGPYVQRMARLLQSVVEQVDAESRDEFAQALALAFSAALWTGLVPALHTSITTADPADPENQEACARRLMTLFSAVEAATSDE